MTLINTMFIAVISLPVCYYCRQFLVGIQKVGEWSLLVLFPTVDLCREGVGGFIYGLGGFRHDDF